MFGYRRIDADLYSNSRNSLHPALYETKKVIRNARAKKLVAQQSQIAQMNSTINQLSNRVDILNMSKLNADPDYNSGWEPINPGQQLILNHNLQTASVLVYMFGYNTAGSYYIHQIKEGGDSDWPNEYGVRWQELTTTTITVYRGAQDPDWNYVCVWMWKIT